MLPVGLAGRRLNTLEEGLHRGTMGFETPAYLAKDKKPWDTVLI